MVRPGIGATYWQLTSALSKKRTTLSSKTSPTNSGMRPKNMSIFQSKTRSTAGEPVIHKQNWAEIAPKGSPEQCDRRVTHREIVLSCQVTGSPAVLRVFTSGKCFIFWVSMARICWRRFAALVSFFSWIALRSVASKVAPILAWHGQRGLIRNTH